MSLPCHFPLLLSPNKSRKLQSMEILIKKFYPLFVTSCFWHLPRLHDFKELKNKIQFFKCSELFFELKDNKMDVTEECCWATTQMAGRWYCFRSVSSVLKFEFQLDPLVHTHSRIFPTGARPHGMEILHTSGCVCRSNYASTIRVQTHFNTTTIRWFTLSPTALSSLSPSSWRWIRFLACSRWNYIISDFEVS
jgi:hypothetical protein